jgi:adenine-specific DNA-methyltransferase
VSRFGKYVTTNETASKELKELVKGVEFSYPKPVSLMSYLLSLIYDYKNEKFDNEFTVLDFFSGSGTTAHAVMELNAIDGGKRKFILVQKPEDVKKESQAYKQGFKTLCDLGEERIKCAGIKIKEQYPNSNFDGGLKVYKISD